MNWIELKKLRETQAKIGQEATALVEASQHEHRALNASENEKFNSLSAEYDRLGNQIAFEEKRNRFDTGPKIGRDDGRLGDERRHDDSTELRALRKGETAVGYLESRGVDMGDGRRLTVGQYIRAAIAGPRDDDERRALQMGSDSSGGFNLPTFTVANALDDLRADSAVIRAGASVIAMTSGNSFARIAADPVPTWRAEGSPVNVQSGVFDRGEYRPKSLVGIVKVTRELLEDAVGSDQSITQVVTQAMAAQLDAAALVGSGADGNPLGIANTPGVLSVSMGTNGGALADYDALIDATYQVESNGGKVTGVVLSPRENATMSKFSDTTGQPLRKPVALESVPFFSSLALPINGTQGTATNASRIVVGDWAKLLVGVTTSMRIEILKERYAEDFSYGVMVYLRGDTFVSRPKSFAQVVGVKV